jgi:hypothetical protein
MDDKDERLTAILPNLLLYGDLIRALTALAAAGVPVIVLKGAALAVTIYPSLADRRMSDADILVQPGQRDRARAALEGAGYRFLPEPPQRFGPFDTEFTGEMKFRWGEHNAIDLHWELTAQDWLRRLAALDMAALWRDARPFAIVHAQALQLSPYDTLLHLCLHLSSHAYIHPNGYRDIRQLLAYEQPFPWDDFVARARSFRLSAMCYFVLDALALMPPEVRAALRPPAWQRWLVPRLADPRRGLAGQLTYNRYRGYLLHLALADRPADVLRVLAWLFFPGPRWLAERYRLRGRWRPWLACAWHPLVVVSQGLQGAWALCKP